MEHDSKHDNGSIPGKDLPSGTFFTLAVNPTINSTAAIAAPAAAAMNVPELSTTSARDPATYDFGCTHQHRCYWTCSGTLPNLRLKLHLQQQRERVLDSGDAALCVPARCAHSNCMQLEKCAQKECRNNAAESRDSGSRPRTSRIELRELREVRSRPCRLGDSTVRRGTSP
jgi:hypothetical protein